jgi:2-oxoglutarate dehydrogenase E2 component (dihydrolipoamide succinyltransferase)
VIIDIKVPALAESIAEAVLLDWKCQPGDAVATDEILIEIETDKVVLEVPAPEAGVLKEIVRKTGASVASEEVIARIDTEGVAAAPAATESENATESPPSEGEPGDLSPAVRKLVAEHDLDPEVIAGTGRGGRLTKGDVLAYLEESDREPAAPLAPPPPPEEPPVAPEPAPRTEERGVRLVPMTRIRARIAERLLEAQQNAAILTTFNEVDMQPVMALRARHKEEFEKVHGARLGFMSFFAKAAVQALKRFPVVNASIEGPNIAYHDYYDIGIAVGSPRGLVVPVLRDVDRLSFAAIEAKIAEFGEKAKKAQLTVDELSGGTFSISNGGIFGSLLSTPILNPPQSAILGMHKTQKRPMVEDDEIVIRPMMNLALSYDHRIIDGREAVQFLVTIKAALEDPGRMLLEL